MKKKLLLGIVCLLLFSGCGKKIDLSEQAEIAMIQDAGEIGKSGAQGAVERLHEIGASDVQKASLISKEKGITLKVQDADGSVYYLGFGDLGYLEIIRKDAKDGKILYAVADSIDAKDYQKGGR